MWVFIDRKGWDHNIRFMGTGAQYDFGSPGLHSTSPPSLVYSVVTQSSRWFIIYLLLSLKEKGLEIHQDCSYKKEMCRKTQLSVSPNCVPLYLVTWGKARIP